LWLGLIHQHQLLKLLLIRVLVLTDKHGDFGGVLDILICEGSTFPLLKIIILV
jgi:hypothetical protein